MLGRMFRKWFGGGCGTWSGGVGLSREGRISYGVMYVRGDFFLVFFAVRCGYRGGLSLGRLVIANLTMSWSLF